MTKSAELVAAELRAKALARWEGEGGGLLPVTDEDSLDDSAFRILTRLGAALLDEWGDVAPAIQEKIVRRARTLGAAGDQARAKENLARILHQYRNEC